MAEKDVTSVLDESGVDYELLPHARTETAAGEAEALGVNPQEVAKTLVLSTPGGYVRAVLAASDRFDLGAVPPFGGAGDRVLVDARLATQETVVLEAGSHEQSVRIRTADLLKLAQAEVVDLAQDYYCRGDDAVP